LDLDKGDMAQASSHDDFLSIYHDVCNCARRQGIHHVLFQRLGGPQRWIVEVECHEIAAVPGGDPADRQPEGLTSRARAEREAGLGIDRLAVGPVDLLKQRSRAHLVEHADPVVRAPTVGPEPDAHAARDQIHEVGDAVAEEHVRARAVGEGGLTVAEQRALGVVEPAAVDGDHGRQVDIERRHGVERSRAEPLERLIDLVALLREVDVPRHAGIARAASAGLDHRGRRAVLAVRRRLHRGQEARAILVARRERLEVRDRLRDRLAVRRGSTVPVVEAARQHDPDPEPARGLDRGARVIVALRVQVIEVADRGHAMQQHLAEREQRRGGHVLGAQPRRVAVQRPIAPLEERQIVADAAQQRLEAVVVRVHRAGDHRAVRPVDAARSGGPRIGEHVRGISDRHDRAVDREHGGGAPRAVDDRAIGRDDEALAHAARHYHCQVVG
jgi:hypothetical protein